MKFSASILTLWAATASAAKIGSYEATNDVTVLSSMGTDLDAIGDALKLGDEGLATAQSLYETGSASTSTFKDLSLNGSAQQVFIDYYGSETYGDEYIMAAFEGGTFAKSNFGGIDATGKEQIIKKGAAYLNAYGAVLEKAGAAVGSCKAGDADAANLAWDEAAALFYGEGGEMVYAMGQKRCENFGTCGADGEAGVNTAIFSKLNEGQAGIASGDCSKTEAAAVAITEHMQIPLVQGVIRAAYKLDKEDGAQKELGYGTVFAAAVLPMVSKCNAGDATTISDNVAPDTTGTDFMAVKTAFENNYACMGITCEQVSGLVGKDGGFLMGAGPCGVEATAMKPDDAEPVADMSTPASDMADMDSGASVVGVVGSAAVATAAFAMLL
jgi:hypothetical protein